MSAARFAAAFFDFDGTLVQSAQAKYQAFFEVFPATPQHRAIIEQVLAADPDGSRHVVIAEMAARMAQQGLQRAAGDPVDTYARAALAAVMACPEMPGASQLLENLSARMAVFIMSNTPHDALEQLIGHRGWQRHLAGFDGYPAIKARTIAARCSQLGISPARAAVIGDGISDKMAASANNCTFFHISDYTALAGAGLKL